MTSCDFSTYGTPTARHSRSAAPPASYPPALAPRGLTVLPRAKQLQPTWHDLYHTALTLTPGFLPATACGSQPRLAT